MTAPVYNGTYQIAATYCEILRWTKIPGDNGQRSCEKDYADAGAFPGGIRERILCAEGRVRPGSEEGTWERDS